MRSPVLYRIVETIKAYLFPVQLVFSWSMPVFAMRSADPIDLLPYFECFGAGILLAVALSRGLVVLARKRVPGLTSSRVSNWVPAIIMLMPPWAVFLGLGANRWLDHSPVTEHLTQTLAWELPIKARARCRVTSWRGRASEEVTYELIYAAEATSPERAVPEAPGKHGAARTPWVYPRACVPRTPLIVASHPGALGWPWIERVRVPGPSDH